MREIFKAFHFEQVAWRVSPSGSLRFLAAGR
jgi:hypothetical protein